MTEDTEDENMNEDYRNQNFFRDLKDKDFGRRKKSNKSIIYLIHGDSRLLTFGLFSSFYSLQQCRRKNLEKFIYFYMTYFNLWDLFT